MFRMKFKPIVFNERPQLGLNSVALQVKNSNSSRFNFSTSKKKREKNYICIYV